MVSPPRAGRTDKPGALSLLSDKPFRRYLTATTLSGVGDGVSAVAVPLTAVVLLHANAAEMGILSALIWVPSLLFAIPLGAAVDRLGRRRRTMVIADLCRFVLVASLAVCAWFDMLTLSQLFITIFAVGIFSSLFTVCENTLFVALVPSGRYVQGQSLTYGGVSIATLAGPPLGGVLVGAFTAPLALMSDAVSFLWSALLLRGIKVVEPPVERTERRGSVSSGMRYIRENSIIRSILLVMATTNLFNLMFNAILVLYMTQNLHLGVELIGFIFGAGAIGGLFGAAATGRLAQRIGVGRAFFVATLLFSAPLLLVPSVNDSVFAVVTGLLLVASAVSGLGNVAQGICIGTLFSSTVPDALRARVRGAFLAVSAGMRPVGALLGGLAGTVIGLQATLWISAIGGVLALLWFVKSPLLVRAEPA